jgi:hypothetical protein
MASLLPTHSPDHRLALRYEVNDTEQLQALFVELLSATGHHVDHQPVLGRSYLALARTCARVLETLDGHDDSRPTVTQLVEERLTSVFETLGISPEEQSAWQALFKTGQYQAFLKHFESKCFASTTKRRKRGMGRITRYLAERALRLKETGVSWSELLSAIISELRAEETPDAESKVLLVRLVEWQAITGKHNSGSYLRLLIARYKAEFAFRWDH